MGVVAVLAGGRSPEHDISLQSGSQVLQNLGPRWRRWPVLLDRDGQWWPAGSAVEGDAADGFRWSSMRPMTPGGAMQFLVQEADVDVVFPVLHGPFGEDGSVQGMLDLHGIPFVGSGCAASAVAMDKIRTRESLSFHGIPMPTAVVPSQPLARLDEATLCSSIEAEVGYPCFLKVDVSGSSLGVHRAANRDDVAEFLQENRHRGRRVMAEALVEGEEITVAVLGNAGGELVPLPPVGIYPADDTFFTYRVKYDPALCDEIVPPRGLDDAQIQAAQQVALTCHEALQCDGMSRTDMIVGDDGLLVLEVNTIPGLTEVSLLPKAAKAGGFPFPALLDRLLELALERGAGR